MATPTLLSERLYSIHRVRIRLGIDRHDAKKAEPLPLEKNPPGKNIRENSLVRSKGSLLADLVKRSVDGCRALPGLPTNRQQVGNGVRVPNTAARRRRRRSTGDAYN
jgi:hypothetical protein